MGRVAPTQCASRLADHASQVCDLLVALLFLTACAAQQGPALPQGRVALRLETLEGEPLTLGTLRGRVVLVTIVNTWSDFALLEVPRFKTLAEAHPKDLTVVCVVLDDDRRMAEIFRTTFEIPYPVTRVDDPRSFTSEDGPFGPITVIPTSILLDREGNIAARMDGMWPANVLEESVQKVAGGI